MLGSRSLPIIVSNVHVCKLNSGLTIIPPQMFDYETPSINSHSNKESRQYKQWDSNTNQCRPKSRRVRKICSLPRWWLAHRRSHVGREGLRRNALEGHEGIWVDLQAVSNKIERENSQYDVYGMCYYS